MGHPKVQMPSMLLTREEKFNSSMVNFMARILGSVGFIWFCLLLDGIGFVALIQQTIQALDTHQGIMILISLWVSFIAQAFIQLVALPVLQNYQNRQSAMQDAKARADHMALTHIAYGIDELRGKYTKPDAGDWE